MAVTFTDDGKVALVSGKVMLGFIVMFGFIVELGLWLMTGIDVVSGIPVTVLVGTIELLAGMAPAPLVGPGRYAVTVTVTLPEQDPDEPVELPAPIDGSVMFMGPVEFVECIVAFLWPWCIGDGVVLFIGPGPVDEGTVMFIGPGPSGWGKVVEFPAPDDGSLMFMGPGPPCMEPELPVSRLLRMIPPELF